MEENILEAIAYQNPHILKYWSLTSFENEDF